VPVLRFGEVWISYSFASKQAELKLTELTTWRSSQLRQRGDADLAKLRPSG
jgi:hypothetical protein